MNIVTELPDQFVSIGDAAQYVVEKLRPIIEWDGKPVSVPGCYSGIPIDLYHGPDICVEASISSSGLRTMFQKSPLDYWFDSPLNPHRDDSDAEERDAFRIGRAVHHLALGEADFGKHFVVRPDSYFDAKTGTEKPWHGSSNTCKAWIEAEKRTVLSSKDMFEIRGMCGVLPAQEGREDSGLKNSSLVMHGALLDGLIEHSFFWQDKKTGVWLRSRPDAIPLSGADFCDLKTTRGADHSEMEKSIGDYRYDMQAALARMAMREVWGADLQNFAFVFVEKTKPYTVAVVEMRPGDLDEADKDLRVLIDTYARCLGTNRWPSKRGTQTDAVYVGLTQWQRDRALARRAFLLKELEAA